MHQRLIKQVTFFALSKTKNECRILTGTYFYGRTVEPRGGPPVDDRRVLRHLFGSCDLKHPWRDLPEAYGLYAAC